MRDANGNEIRLGDQVVMLKKCSVIKRGSIGEVRDIRDSLGEWGKGPHCRVTCGPDDNPHWSAWCRSSEFALVRVARAVPPAPGAGGEVTRGQ